nr:retrovirus-related Pol polyprotein from transposon TNT 1-94 [Tanacetum cinerariifolium]
MKVKESPNVTFNESPPPTKLSPLVDDDVGEEDAIRNNTKTVNTNNEEDESIEVEEIVNIKESKNHPLGTKWVFRNKLDENGIVSRNKAILVAQGYNQQEGTDYDKTYDPVARFKPTKTLMSTEIKLTKDYEADFVDSSKYRAEYVSVGKACQQALWMKQALIDYGIRLDNFPIMFDNKGAID